MGASSTRSETERHDRRRSEQLRSREALWLSRLPRGSRGRRTPDDSRRSVLAGLRAREHSG